MNKKKKKRGRPKVAKSKFKGKIVNLRVTEAEHRLITRVAKREGLPVSEWMRRLILRAPGEGR